MTTTEALALLVQTLLILMGFSIIAHQYLAPIARRRKEKLEAERRAKRDVELAALRAQRPKVGMEVGSP